MAVLDDKIEDHSNCRCAPFRGGVGLFICCVVAFAARHSSRVVGSNVAPLVQVQVKFVDRCKADPGGGS